MKMNMETVVDGMLVQVKAYGLKEMTIKYYQDVCHIIIQYFEEEEGGIYSKKSLQRFKSLTDERCVKGEICYEYCRFINRVIRMLSSYAETGSTDFSSKIIPKKYLPSQSHQVLIQRILDENKLVNGSRQELDTVMRHFFCYIESKNIAVCSITDKDFFDFMQEVSESNKGSLGRTWRALRLISEFLKMHHLAKLKANLSMLKMKGASIRLIEPFSQEEIALMISAIDTSSQIGIRDKAIILLAFETGLRAIDITELEYADIDWKAATIHVKQRKTGRCITLPLNPTVMNALADYIIMARPEHDSLKIFITSKEPVHPFMQTASLGKMVDKYCAKAEVEKKPWRRFHSLRRAFATELSMAGVPLPTISLMLGHKCIDEDRPYLSYDAEKIAFCSLDFSGIPIASGIYSVRPSLSITLGGDDE